MQARDAAGDGLVGELVREGDYWTIEFAERELRVRDSKGIGYLAELLAHPGVEIGALELAGGKRADRVSASEAAQAGLESDGDIGAPLLDAEAKSAYRVRLEALQQEIEEADAFHDPERLERARAEYAFVADELSAAVGLGGRDRRAGTSQERARVNVTRSVKATIAHIAEHDRALGEHLRSCVHTGRVCVYRPDIVSPVTWTVSQRKSRQRRPHRPQLPVTQYARSGLVNIAYQVVGDGPIDLVFVPGLVSHLDLQWADPRIAGFFERLASFSRLILLDKRGTGLSDPVAAPAPLEDRMDDVRAVMDAAGCERAALLGLSEGGSMSVLFAATYPERTSALVLCGTYPTGVLDPDDNPGGQTWVDVCERVRNTAVAHWGDGQTLALYAPSADSALDRIGRGIFERSAASPQMVHTIIEMAIDLDVRDFLPSIRVPTLVLHRAEEIVPIACGRYMAEHIPDARLVVLPGIDHIPFYGDADRYAEEIKQFLTVARPAPEPDRVLTTVMFTRIAEAEERGVTPSDPHGRELIARHDELVRTQLERHRGRAVRATGDGVLATFDGPARGIRCARAIVEAVRPSGLQVRAGLHTGECGLLGHDIDGIAVDIGVQISALAGTDEVLVSSTVKDLVIGSGITFTDRGTKELAGVPGELHLFAVKDVRAPGSDQVVPDTRQRRISGRAAVAAARNAPKLAQRMIGRRTHT